MNNDGEKHTCVCVSSEKCNHYPKLLTIGCCSQERHWMVYKEPEFTASISWD